MRRAFTLIEMLVVIFIITLLMGLTIGAFATSRRQDRLLASEHLLGDLVRQARHTARTSGAPVVLRLSKGKRTISGVSRQPLISVSFDDAVHQSGNVLGRSGRGLRNDLLNASGMPTVYPEIVLAVKDHVTRGNQGFYLSCAVRPPAVVNGPLIIPLVALHLPLVGGTPPPPLMRTETMTGLYLRNHQRLAMRMSDQGDFHAPSAAGPALGGAPDTAIHSWEIVGWLDDGHDDEDVFFYNPATTPGVLSSLDDPPPTASNPDDEPVLHTTVAAEPYPNDIAGPITGGAWEEIGLLFDGAELQLYRNGQRVGVAIPVSQPPVLNTEAVTIGRLSFTGSDYTSALAIIDDVRLERLAHSDAGEFPGDIAPDADHRIVAHPDGRIEVDGGTANAVITLRGAKDLRGRAEVTISLDGMVTTELKLEPSP